MKLTVIAIGRLKERHWREAADDYLKRLAPYARIAITEVSNRDVTANESRALELEGKDILRAIPTGAIVVALDPCGRQCSSEGFADWLHCLGLEGKSHVAFIIGGAAGLHAAVQARADESISLGLMTLPHQMARVVLLEQLYRAFRINAGEPYHR